MLKSIFFICLLFLKYCLSYCSTDVLSDGNKTEVYMIGLHDDELNLSVILMRTKNECLW